jgi:CRISPR-associated protein Cas2
MAGKDGFAGGISVSKLWQRFKIRYLKCLIDPVLLKQLQYTLEGISIRKVSIRYYYLGDNRKPRVEHVGANPGYDVEGPLIY